MIGRRFGNRKFLFVLGGLVLILLYNFTPLGRSLSWLEEPLVRLGGKFYRTGLDFRDFWRGLTAGSALRQELSDKEKALGELARANTDLQFLNEENGNLRALLGLKEKTKGYNLVGADVIWLQNEAGRSLLTINRGQADGIKEKMPVVAGEGVFIGKIIKAGPRTSVALLTADRSSAVAATSARDPDLQAIAKGKMGLGLSLELIPQGANIESGDIIITSTLEENTPLGLSLGRVASVSYKEGELFKRASLEPLLSISALRVVAVLVPNP